MIIRIATAAKIAIYRNYSNSNNNNNNNYNNNNVVIIKKL